MARISLEELRNRTSTVDRAKLDATTEADITAQRAADGDADLDVPENVEVIEPPRALRVRLGMTQTEIAEALNIPVGTWRNWEQGRTKLEPTALALLRIVSRHPGVLWVHHTPPATNGYTLAPVAMLNGCIVETAAPMAVATFKGNKTEVFGDFPLTGKSHYIPSALRSAKVKRPVATPVYKKER